MKELIRISTRVNVLEERFERYDWHKAEGESGDGYTKQAAATHKTRSLGWYINFEGSYECIFIGHLKPDGLEVGDHIILVIAKEGTFP